MELLAHFHFIRPWWLLASVPLLVFCYWLWRHQQQSSGLEAHINNDLLQHLLVGKPADSGTQYRPWLFSLLAIIWFVISIALAGPAWEKRPQPVFEAESAVVILLDLSPSMAAEDIKPSRINRAHIKIQDFLGKRKDGLTALIVYAGEAFVVTPLTDDDRTITNLLPTLKPGLLPIPGSNVEMAVAMASQLLRDSRIGKASLLLITDDIDPNAVNTIENSLADNSDLTILGIGTADGAPIPSQGDFIKDSSGNMVIAKRNDAVLQQVADVTNGYFLPMQADTRDIDFFERHLQQRFSVQSTDNDTSRTHDLWYEFGPTLVLLLLPLTALLFRRGWLLSLTLVSTSLFTFYSQPLYAASWWDQLWQNPDQRGQQQWQQQNYEAAANAFDDSAWRGSALYKNGDYAGALEEFTKDSSAIGDYNRGNALAQLQRYPEAIAAYDAALKKQPDLQQAVDNKALVEELLKKQQQNQQPNQQQQESNQKNQQAQSNNSNSDSENQDSTASNNSEDNTGTEQQNSSPSDNNNADNNNAREDKELANAQENTADDQAQPNQTEKDGDQTGNSAANVARASEALSEEEQQALQQWLQKVPDDPSGLLRRKFEYEFQQRRKDYQQGRWSLPENNAHQRY